jgi:hypothetical protein
MGYKRRKRTRSSTIQGVGIASRTNGADNLQLKLNREWQRRPEEEGHEGSLSACLTRA